MYKEFEVVALKTDFPSAKLKAGAVGTVLLVYSGPPRAYEVEFPGADGTFTLPEEQLVPTAAPASPSAA